MPSIKELEAENDRLGRELADACMEIVDCSFICKDLYSRLKGTEHAFSKFIVNNNLAASIEAADVYVKKLVNDIKNPTEQLISNFESKEKK
jgi:hypothetical protein